MTLARRRLLGWGGLGVLALLGALWLARLDYGAKITSDVLELIPADEREPELMLVRQLASQAEARTMLLVLATTDGRPVPAVAGTRLAALLTGDPAFAAAMAIDDPAPRDALGRELFEQRFALLWPRWLQERETAYAAARAAGPVPEFSTWLAQEVAARLGRFLNTPEALAFQEVIPADPLLLMPEVVSRLKGGLALVATESGRAGPALVWAQLAASPLSEAGQGPAFGAIERAVATLRAEFPGLTVAYTGVNRFAATSRDRIEREVSWLNLLSLAAVLAVAFTFVRGAWRALHLAPVILLSVLGAWVSVTFIFDRVHMLVFVVGSLLTGVAIDYGFYLYMQRPATPEEDYWSKVRRLAKPLLASCFTTVAGFALLLISDLPLIRQLGLFVGAGLVCALAAAVLYFSTVKNCFLEARAIGGGRVLPVAGRNALRRVVVVLWLAALPGLAMLQWKDDIRELEIPSPELKQEDARIRSLFGERENRAVYLTYGADVLAARESVAAFEAWLAEQGGGRTQIIGLAAIVPTRAEHARAVAFLRDEGGDFSAKLRSALAEGGFDPAEFESYFEAIGRWSADPARLDLATAIRALQAKLAGPLGLLVHAGQPMSWFVTLTDEVHPVAPPAELRTVGSSQLMTLNQVFARYRQSALWLSVAGLIIVGAGVFLTYGLRDGARIFAIPCGACLGLFGVFGWLGQPLNLFHLLGAFLGVCLTHNYSIFTATSAYRGEAPPVSVRMSALTTASSFGVLGLSGIPVVAALGTTVAWMVVAALVVIEFEHLSPLGGKP